MSYADEFEVDAPDRPRPLSWSALVAGAIAALTVHFLLNLLGLGIGAVNLDGATGQDGDVLGGGAFAWWSISGIIAAAVGGVVAGRLAKQGAHFNTASHGLGAWALSTLVVVASIGGMLGGGAMSTAGPLSGQLAEYADVSAAARASDLAPEETAALGARAEAAADRVGAGALLSFVALLIGAMVAAFSARWAGQRVRAGEPAGRARGLAGPDQTRERVERRPH